MVGWERLSIIVILNIVGWERLSTNVNLNIFIYYCNSENNNR
jgi:hypothetical protein